MAELASNHPLPVRKPFLVRNRTKIALLVVLAILAFLLFDQPRWAGIWQVQVALFAVGYLLIVVGVLGRLWCTLYIGGRKEKVLQCTGPYSLARHPLYVSNLFLTVGLGILIQHPVIFVVMLVFFIVQYRATIGYEESVLLAYFGEVYEDYQRRVPQFLPRLSGFDPTPPETVNLGPLRDEVPTTVVFLILPPVVQLLSLLHVFGVLPDWIPW